MRLSCRSASRVAQHGGGSDGLLGPTGMTACDGGNWYHSKSSKTNAAALAAASSWLPSASASVLPESASEIPRMTIAFLDVWRTASRNPAPSISTATTSLKCCCNRRATADVVPATTLSPQAIGATQATGPVREPSAAKDQ